LFVVQQIKNKSTTNLQQNPRQIHNYQLAVQLVVDLLFICCTTNPFALQQITTNPCIGVWV